MCGIGGAAQLNTVEPVPISIAGDMMFTLGEDCAGIQTFSAAAAEVCGQFGARFANEFCSEMLKDLLGLCHHKSNVLDLTTRKVLPVVDPYGVGSPCQPEFSQEKKFQQKDVRSTPLAKILGQLSRDGCLSDIPSCGLFENVLGIKRVAVASKRFQRMIRLQQIKYVVYNADINRSFYLPHHRPRVYFLCLKNIAAGAAILMAIIATHITTFAKLFDDGLALGCCAWN